MKSALTGKTIKIGESKYKVIKKIDEGSFSDVYEGYSEAHKRSIAVKHFSFLKTQRSAYEAYVKEVTILDEIQDNPNIVRLLDK
jgi:serine/threonine protein kinase